MLIISVINLSMQSIDSYILLFYSLFMIANSIINSIKSSQDRSIRIRTFNEETYIFDREFKHFGFSLLEYRKFIKKKANLKRTQEEKLTFSQEGKDASKVILFISIPHEVDVLLTMKSNPIVKIGESSWFGSVELTKRYFGQINNCYSCTMKLSNPMKKEVVWIEWNTNDLMSLITKHKGTTLGTKLLLILSNYLCKTVITLKEYSLQAHELRGK